MYFKILKNGFNKTVITLTELAIYREKGGRLRHRNPINRKNPVCKLGQNNLVYLYFEYFIKFFPSLWQYTVLINWMYSFPISIWWNFTSTLFSLYFLFSFLYLIYSLGGYNRNKTRPRRSRSQFIKKWSNPVWVPKWTIFID